MHFLSHFLPRTWSLRFKLTAIILLVALSGVWGFVLYLTSSLEDSLRASSVAHLRSHVQQITTEMDAKLAGYKARLAATASGLDWRRLNDARYLQNFLTDRYRFQLYFAPRGLILIGQDGRALADYPVMTGRRGTRYNDRRYFQEVVATGKLFVDDPILSRFSSQPVLILSAPVTDDTGTIRAIVAGIIDLTLPEFLGEPTDAALLGDTERYVISLQSESFIASSDKARVLTRVPSAGQSEIMDHIRNGLDGSLISTSSEGIEKVYAAARLKEANWIVVDAIPTAILFKPIYDLRIKLLSGATVVTLLALALAASLFRRVMGPLERTTQQLDAMSSGLIPLAHLPEDGEPEIRKLLASFNRLTQTLAENQERLQQSEKTYRTLFEHMQDGFAYCHMDFANGQPVDWTYLAVNQAFEAQTGLKNVIGSKVSDVIPGIREADPGLFEIYGRVANTGKPEHFEAYVNALEQWFAIAVYGPAPGYFVAIFDVITKRKQAEAGQLATTQMLQTIIDTLPQYVFWKDRQSRYLGSNKALARLAGVGSPADMVGKSDYDFPWRQYAPLYQDDDAEVMRTGMPKHNIIEPLDLGGGPVRWLETSKEPLRSDSGEVYGVLGVFRDVTERKMDEDRLRQAAKVFESTTEGVVITDPDAQIVAVNQAFQDITGYPQSEIIGKTPRVYKSDRHDEDFYRAMWAELAHTGTWRGEIWNRRKNGEVFPTLTTINAVKDDSGRLANYVSVFSDLSSLKYYELEMEFMANHDPLTRLPNRVLLNDRLRQAIQHAKREGMMVAVLLIDLDHFKQVNDGLGHPIGDRLLEVVAGRLINSVRGEDSVARLGGDEFVIILDALEDVDGVPGVAEKVLAAVGRPFLIDNHTLFVAASVGISLFPHDGDNTVALLKNADAAMYQAKERGRNTFAFYNSSLTKTAQDHIHLEAALRKAIEQQEFILHFQPQIGVISGTVVGAEALVRWEHPQSGLIAPQRFIPFAEKTGLIVPLGHWVLLAACEQLSNWLERGLPRIRVAVNLSPRQFMSRDLVKEVRAILEATGVPSNLIELEITEGAIMEQGEEAIAKLAELKALGISLAIDDFGTGYSSLAYLRRFPIDLLKIDQSFMRDIPNDAGAAQIALTIMSMAKNLGLRVLAEGVETSAQLAFLQNHGCDLSQGYLHGRPVAAFEFERLLSNGILGMISVP